MITIPANTAFKAFAPTFTLQGPDTTTAVTVSISVDGDTFTALEDTFTGAQTFSNYATNTFLKCSAAVMCSDDSAKIVSNHTVTINATNCTIEGVGPVSNGTITVADGTSIALHVLPYNGYKFVGWSDGDENPTKVISVVADTTVGCECVAIHPFPVPPTTPLFAYGIDAKAGETVVENFMLSGLYPSDHEIPGVEIPESYRDIEYYASGDYFFFNTNPTSATDFYAVTNSEGTWSAQKYTVNEWAPMEEGIDARHMFKTDLTSPCAVSALVEVAESGEESIGAILYAMWDLESDPTISYQTSNSSFLGVFTPTEEHPVPYVGAGLYTSDGSHTLVSTIKELNVELPIVH